MKRRQEDPRDLIAQDRDYYWRFAETCGKENNADSYYRGVGQGLSQALGHLPKKKKPKRPRRRANPKGKKGAAP